VPHTTFGPLRSQPRRSEPNVGSRHIDPTAKKKSRPQIVRSMIKSRPVAANDGTGPISRSKRKKKTPHSRREQAMQNCHSSHRTSFKVRHTRLVRHLVERARETQPKRDICVVRQTRSAGGHYVTDCQRRDSRPMERKPFRWSCHWSCCIQSQKRHRSRGGDERV